MPMSAAARWTVGADTVLLVPGKVSNQETENLEQCWSRSQEEVRKAIPLAEELKVRIAIEVVWNDFLTTPQQLVKYVDEFKNPIVGAYFDCSNMIKYGIPPAAWIRALGKRMFKFDFKGYSHEKKWVYGALILTIAGFLVLMTVPFFTVSDSIGKHVPAIGGSATGERAGH
jgi:sugar phosphate isomerase/epimerase